jgi:addiction module RelE/StbE family toxin
MRLVWKHSAKIDRRNIRAFIGQNNPRAAYALDELFEKQAALLLEYPRMGRPGRRAGTREWVVHPNYILVYDLTQHHIRILRILHVARQWP